MAAASFQELFSGVQPSPQLMNCWKLEIKMSITRRSDIISWDHNLPSNQLAKKLLQHKCVVQWLGFSSLIPPIRCIHYIVSSIWVGTVRTAPHCQVITLLADENWRGVDTLDTAAAEPKHWTFIAAAARCCRLLQGRRGVTFHIQHYGAVVRRYKPPASFMDDSSHVLNHFTLF